MTVIRRRALGGLLALIGLWLAACSSQADRAEQFFTESVAALKPEPAVVESILRDNQMGMLVECGMIPELNDIFAKYQVDTGLACSTLISGVAQLAQADLQSVACNEIDKTEGGQVMIACDFTVNNPSIDLPAASADIVLVFDGDKISDAYVPAQ